MTWLSRAAKKPEPSLPAPSAVDTSPPLSGVDGAECFDAVESARRDVRDRIHEVNGVTEREVLAAAGNVAAIVEHATTTIGGLKLLAARFDGGGEESGIGRAIGDQTEMVRLFVAELVELTRVQAEASTNAQNLMLSLRKATQAIDRLATEARILALNARIEAGRGVGETRASSVVSDEMRRLASAVATTNTDVLRVSTSVSVALADVVKSSKGMRERVDRFANESIAGSDQLLAQVESFRSDTAATLAETDRQMSDAVRCSHAALSNLQFQDVTAQGLLRLDGRMRNLQVKIASACGLDDRIAKIEPAAHEEVGGEKAVLQKAAGELIFL